MSAHRDQLTDAQHKLLGALDDANEHVMAEWDRPEPHSVGTCGFARIVGIDGRGSFVRAMKSLAERGHVQIDSNRRGIESTIGSLNLSLREDSYRGGYSLSVTNVPELIGGPAHQRLAVRQELHRLILTRLQTEWGYMDSSRVYTRID